MASELFKSLRADSQRKKRNNGNLLEKNKCRSAIENMCKEYLVDFEDILRIEVLGNALTNVIELITEPELNAKYEFFQESEAIFQIRLRELDL